MRPKVLIIDEVDVFLSENFYGQIYMPSLHLKDPLIKLLLDEIWSESSKKSKTLTPSMVKSFVSYKKCASKFSNWQFILDEAIKDMLAAVKSFKTHSYVVHDDRIAYIDGDSVATNVVCGYDTVWAYFYEHERGNISTKSLDYNVGLTINCGTFSFAEMPLEFVFIFGVTGTLQTLNRTEKDILRNVYKIKSHTFVPSVFGKSNRTYNPKTDVIVTSRNEYFERIRNEIDNYCAANRAILVFFDSVYLYWIDQIKSSQ